MTKSESGMVGWPATMKGTRQIGGRVSRLTATQFITCRATLSSPPNERGQQGERVTENFELAQTIS